MVSGIDYVLQVVGRLFAAVAAGVMTACSGGAGGPAARPSAAQLQASQDAACQRVVPKVTDCAIESARTEMSAERFAELARDIEELAARNSEQYIDQCTRSPMSARQIAVYDGCRLDVPCEQFLSCVDRAKPRAP